MLFKKSDFKHLLDLVRSEGSQSPSIALDFFRKRLRINRFWRFESVEKRFTKYYRTNHWGNKESRSGSGSTLRSTASFRKNLENYLREGNVKSLFDAPCGDFNWMKEVDFPDGFQYTGGDIVAPLISDLKDRFGNENYKFLKFDITADKFPEADLWLCRECLFHLSDRHIKKVFANFLRSNIPAALITNVYGNTAGNFDIETGGYRDLNFYEEPFRFTVPKIRYEDWVEGTIPREICLWTRDEIGSFFRS